MKKLLLSVLALFFITPVFATEMPLNSVDSFAKRGIKGTFIETYDPSYIIIKLENGDTIDTAYHAIDGNDDSLFESLYEWQNEATKTGIYRDVFVTYTNLDGVIVEEPLTGIRFKLSGVIETHPIDVAKKKCEAKYDSTIGRSQCKDLALTAWDAELNRAYKELGGASNSNLKSAQLSWIKYRDAQSKYISSEYGARAGTMWRYVSIERIIDITRNQTNLLKSIKEW